MGLSHGSAGSVQEVQPAQQLKRNRLSNCQGRSRSTMCGHCRGALTIGQHRPFNSSFKYGVLWHVRCDSCRLRRLRWDKGMMGERSPRGLLQPKSDMRCRHPFTQIWWESAHRWCCSNRSPTSGAGILSPTTNCCMAESMGSL